MSISSKANIGVNVTFGEYPVVEDDVVIGDKVTVGHHVIIHSGVRIGDGCVINDNFLGRTEERKKHFGGPTLKRGARIGANATILPNLVIGEDAVVAAGSVVTKDVPPRVIVVGSPAKVLRPVPEEQLIENQVFYDK